MRNGMVAVLLVLLVIGSGITGYLVGVANPHTTTETTTLTIVTTTLGVTTITTYRPLGILLGLSGNSSVPVGRNETIEVSLTNELPYSNNATYTGVPVLPRGGVLSGYSWGNYVLPVPPSCGNIPSGYIQYFVVVYNQSGAPLQLNDGSPSILTCISVNRNYYMFSPSQVFTESISIGGFWKSSDLDEPWINATYTQFSPGTYTVVAFDPWSQLAEMNFTIARALGVWRTW